MPGTILTAQQRAHCKSILQFWHQLEFFIPFDLQGQILEHRHAGWAVRIVSHRDLLVDGNEADDLWQVERVPEGQEVSGFELYLGVFDKSLLATMTQAAIAAILDPELPETERIEQAERADLEGATCFAKIKLNRYGEPLLDQLSVSTVPWALGQVAQGELAVLDMHRFDAGLKELQDALQNFTQARARSFQAPPANDDGRLKHMPLTRAELAELLAVFQDWAGFTPSSGAAAVVRALAAKPPKETAARPVQGGQIAIPLDAGEDESEEDDGLAVEIEILNSFYARDLQKVMRAIDSGEIGPAMLAYLTPLLRVNKTDLYCPDGRARILADLHPGRLPHAQWLGEPEHAMSLMQQFAINNMFTQLEQPGLFAVNGPPGTGKTTLLRDLFAENITRRALLLAACDSAADAFCPNERFDVEFQNSRPVKNLSRLRPELCGYEMVVASSNNAAVDNISRDLPKAKSIGKQQRSRRAPTAWRNADGTSRVNYLRPVAHRLAAQNSKGEYVDLDPDDAPWALISAALGRRGNRRHFSDGLRFPAQGPGKPPEGYDPDNHQSIWQWREKYAGASFDQAKAVLLKAQHAFLTRQAGLVEMASLQERLGGHTLQSWVEAHVAALAAAEETLSRAQRRAAQTARELAATQALQVDLKAIEALLERDKPSWWRRWLQRSAYAAFEQELAANRLAQRQALQRKIDLEQLQRQAALELVDLSGKVEAARTSLATREADWEATQTALADRARNYPQARCPASPEDLEQAQWQREGLWHDRELSSLRAHVFAAALELQQAWLADVLKSKLFSTNIFAACNMLSGQRPSDPASALVLWQSLFMVVPVVSSTFASIADQFRDLGPESLGWLFIDEAGQAVPQAAPGAIWRSKRVVVVGDPMQIEPVFTVPIRLIDALAAISSLPADMAIKPHQASVQTLADAATHLGAWVKTGPGGRQWIGSPLRVHRRCADPMFSIANAIAYDNKMVYGLSSTEPPSDSLDLGPSAWVQLAGRAQQRQAVPEQIELILRALVALYVARGTLPRLYVITPFKAIKAELVATLGDPERWRKLIGPQYKLPQKTVLRYWCQAHVGTVHTFQGKEQELVWMVLGCDASSAGAVNWASQKPNLLNVALTRAQHRVFVIGDRQIWGGKPYFQSVGTALPMIGAGEFVRRCRMDDPEGAGPGERDGILERVKGIEPSS